MLASHSQVHLYGFSEVVNLLDSPPGTALHAMLSAQEYVLYESRVTTRGFLRKSVFISIG